MFSLRVVRQPTKYSRIVSGGSYAGMEVLLRRFLHRHPPGSLHAHLDPPPKFGTAPHILGLGTISSIATGNKRIQLTSQWTNEQYLDHAYTHSEFYTWDIGMMHLTRSASAQ